jgi:hypothetical protein
VSASELREFRRQHDLAPGKEAEGAAEVDLRDEIEAEIEAAAAEEEAARKKAEEEAAAAEAERQARGESEDDDQDEESEDSDSEDTESDGSEAEGRPRRRRRGRRGRRGRSSSNKLEGTFDHGDEGFGLWLDPAVQDIQAYSENWAGQRDVTVTVEADQIVIRRAGEPEDES